jgi:L-alanine-DL-glutamate epimerase-like enolase superfamily enzyme
MRITSIDIYQADIPLHEPFRIAIMTMESARNVFIHLHTDAGISGWGESSPYWKLCGETQEIDRAAARDLALLIKGSDPGAIEARLADLEGYLAHNSQIIAAFDMALYDILARAAGMPLYRFLGGEKRPMTTDLTIGIDTPEVMARKALDIVHRGFPAVKVKLGTTAAEDISRVQKIRQAIGPAIPIRTDANQGWDYPTAATVLGTVQQFGVQYCEQPVPHWDHDAMARLRTVTTVPIMADESVFDHHDAYKLCRAEACDYINIKLSKSGGIRNALAINAVAEAAGKACMIGCMMESRLGLSAAAHFASARRNVKFFDLDTALLLKEDPVTGGFTYDGAVVNLTDDPGLGCDVDPAYLKRWKKVTI